jgi:DNA-binding IclR family transcriptional regulator
LRVTEQSVLEFVSRSFRSVWPLELLHVLHQEPRIGWETEDLAHELRANIPVVTQGLATLEAIGLVTADADRRYRFDPVSPELAEMAREVIALYNQKPRAVLRAIFSAPSDRIQTFADAFRLRKGRDAC